MILFGTKRVLRAVPGGLRVSRVCALARLGISAANDNTVSSDFMFDPPVKRCG